MKVWCKCRLGHKEAWGRHGLRRILAGVGAVGFGRMHHTLTELEGRERRPWLDGRMSGLGQILDLL